MQVQSIGAASTTMLLATGSFAQALEAVRQVPGVSSGGVHQPVAVEWRLRESYGVQFESNLTNDTLQTHAFRYAVTPGYFETMRIPLRRGRLLDERDAPALPWPF